MSRSKPRVIGRQHTPLPIPHCNACHKPIIDSEWVRIGYALFHGPCYKEPETLDEQVRQLRWIMLFMQDVTVGERKADMD